MSDLKKQSALRGIGTIEDVLAEVTEHLSLECISSEQLESTVQDLRLFASYGEEHRKAVIALLCSIYNAIGGHIILRFHADIDGRITSVCVDEKKPVECLFHAVLSK
jgi:hypothetical protein